MSTALFYIHDQGIIHNDIKPANILFSQSRGAVLIDFGLSTGPRTVHAGGTPWYIPAEYAIRNRRGAPGDIFALGVVMLFVLGKIPLPGCDARQLYWKIADVRASRNGAKETMFDWLSVVEQAAEDLPEDFQGSLVKQLLHPYQLRIDAAQLVRRLGSTFSSQA